MDILVLIIVVVFAVAIIVLDRRRFASELAGERHRSDELLDRLMAGSLAEYHFVSAEKAKENTPPQPSEQAGRWVHDPMGLNTVFVPAGEDA